MLYDFKCDTCGFVKEVSCSMNEITDLDVMCPECTSMEQVSHNPKGITEAMDGRWLHMGPRMRRLFGVATVQFKGDDWNDKVRQRADEDLTIKRQRRKARVLKDRGVVPQQHCLGLKESERRYDEKFAEKDLGVLYGDVGKPKAKKEKGS
jgi:predicted nucleic acid-binding Zn ribbon protein